MNRYVSVTIEAAINDYMEGRDEFRIDALATTAEHDGIMEGIRSRGYAVARSPRGTYRLYRP